MGTHEGASTYHNHHQGLCCNPFIHPDGPTGDLLKFELAASCQLLKYTLSADFIKEGFYEKDGVCRSIKFSIRVKMGGPN